MFIDAAAKGKLDLSQIGQFVKLEPGTNLSGLVNADVLANGNLAVIQKKQPGEFSASGILDISNLNYASKELPQPLKNGNLTIRKDILKWVKTRLILTLQSKIPFQTCSLTGLQKENSISQTSRNSMPYLQELHYLVYLTQTSHLGVINQQSRKRITKRFTPQAK